MPSWSTVKEIDIAGLLGIGSLIYLLVSRWVTHPDRALVQQNKDRETLLSEFKAVLEECHALRDDVRKDRAAIQDERQAFTAERKATADEMAILRSQVQELQVSLAASETSCRNLEAALQRALETIKVLQAYCCGTVPCPDRRELPGGALPFLEGLTDEHPLRTQPKPKQAA